MDPASIRETIRELLAQHTPVHFEPRGPSMRPTVVEGDIVTIRPARSEAVLPGHVVLLNWHGRLILHRTIRRTANGALLTTGDAALRTAEEIPLSAVIGIAEWRHRGGRIRRMDLAGARWSGLARYYIRPLRRVVDVAYRRFIKT